MRLSCTLFGPALRTVIPQLPIPAGTRITAAARTLSFWSLVLSLLPLASQDSALAAADPGLPLASSSGLRGEFFQFTNAIAIMPNVNGRVPDFAAVFPNVSFPNTSAAFKTTDGFAPTNRLGQPFVTTFAARFTGSITLSAAGDYEFDVSSDDGSILKLNGQPILDRNYLTGCSQTSTKLSLPAGTFPIELDYFQNFGASCLDFRVSGPGAVTFSPAAVSSPIEAVIAAGFGFQVFAENIGFPTAISYLSGGTFGEGLLVGDTASSGGFGAVLKFDRAGSATVVSDTIASPQGFALSPGISFGGALFVVDDYIPAHSFPAPGNRDAGSDHLKRLMINGTLSDFAGFPGANRIAFGQGAFGSDLYVPDSYAQKISHVKASGAVSDFVTGKPFYALAISVGGPFGNFMYAGEYGGDKIWKIAPDGTVTLFASNIPHPSGLALDPAGKFGGDLFVFSSAGDPLATNSARTIFRIKSDGTASPFATGLRARFGGDLAFGFDGDLFVLEDGRGRVLRARPTAFVAPLMLLPSKTVDFGLVLVGSTNSRVIPLQNRGGSDLVVSGVTIDSPQFQWIAPSLPFTLAPGGQTNLALQFAPASLGVQTAAATFQSNGALATTLELSGRAEERQSFFIEAEDFNFGGGQHRAEADAMPYLGGAYAGLSAIAEVDYHDPSGNESAVYRPSDQKVPTTASPDPDRGAYEMIVDYKIGWNDAGDWYNYTRTFPAAGADYHLFARLSSGALANAIQIDQVTAGATTTNQTLVKIGEARGPASGDWNRFLTVAVLGSSGQLATVHLAGEQTLRVTILPGGNEDFNYVELVPASSHLPAPTTNCLPPPAGLTGWWPGEGDVRDVASTNAGTINGGITFVPGEVGQALHFNGKDASVKIPATPSLNVGAGSGLTLEAWMNPDDITAQAPILEWNNGSFGAHLWIFNGPGVLFANLVDTNGRYHMFNSANSILIAHIFQHIALTYDQATGLARLFRNGEIVAEQNLGKFNPQTGYDLYFGYRVGGPHFQGALDEISLFNRALQTSEIDAIYAAGASGKCKTGGSMGNHAPGIVVTPLNLNFGSLARGATNEMPLAITNSGSATLTVSSLNVSNTTAFSITSPALPFSLNPGDGLLLRVQFHPDATGTYQGGLAIASNDPSLPSPLAIALAGTGVINSSPAVVGIDPPSGSPGSIVLLNGSGFSPVILSNQVTINGSTAAVVSATPAQLAVVLPSSLAPGPVKITVTVNSATSAPAQFVVAPMGGAILRVGRSNADTVVSWPELTANAQLESTSSLEPPVIWTPVNTPPSSDRGRKTVKFPPAQKKQFYRLRNAGVPGGSQQGGASTGHAMVSAAIGGTVTAEDQSATLVVPAGALAQDTDIQITSVHLPGPDDQTPSGHVFLSPEGLTFAKPVALKVQLPFNPPEGYQLDVQLLSGENAPIDAGGEASYFQAVTNYVLNPAQAQVEVPLTHFSVLTWWLDKMLYSVFHIPGKYLMKGDLIYALTGSNGGQGGTWRPGHCGLYLGTQSAFSDVNDGDTIIEATTTHDLLFGEVRFDHLHSTGLEAFDNFNGEHIYLGARRPLTFDPTDNERTEIADWAIGQLHKSYTIIGGGAFLAHDPPLLYEGFTCVGLTEQAYEFGAGKRIVPQIARILPTPFYQFQFTRPVTVVEMDAGDSIDIKVYGIVNRGRFLNDYSTSDELYTRALNLDFSNEEARDAIAAKRATFQSPAFGANPSVYGLLSFTPATADAGKTFTFAFDIDATKSNAGKERATLTIIVRQAPQAVFVRQDPPVIRVDSSSFGGDLVVKTNMAFVTDLDTGALLPIKWDVPPAQVASGQIITMSLQPDNTGVPARVSWSNGDLSVAAPRRLYGDLLDSYSLYPNFRNYQGSDTDHAFIGYPPPGTACDSFRTCFDLSQRSVSPTFKVPDSAGSGFAITLHFEGYGGLAFGGSGYRGGNITWNYVSKP